MKIRYPIALLFGLFWVITASILGAMRDISKISYDSLVTIVFMMFSFGFVLIGFSVKAGEK